MITKEMVIQTITKEVGTIKHLADKILPDTHNWKPTENQRSILELLQYLSHIGTTYSQMLTTGKIDHFNDNAEKAKEMTPDQFNSKMDRELVTMTNTINGLTDTDLETKMIFFGGGEVTKSWIVLFLMENLIAYRMQLFLYLKQSGRPELSTFNNWMGMDAPQQ